MIQGGFWIGLVNVFGLFLEKRLFISFIIKFVTKTQQKTLQNVRGHTWSPPRAIKTPILYEQILFIKTNILYNYMDFLWI